MSPDVEKIREAVAKAIGSFVVHDDHGGPDTLVLQDVLPGTYEQTVAMVYEIADAVLARLEQEGVRAPSLRGVSTDPGPRCAPGDSLGPCYQCGAPATSLIWDVNADLPICELHALRDIVSGFLAADRESLANHRPKGGLADAVDNAGVAYQSQWLADLLARARDLQLDADAVNEALACDAQPPIGGAGGEADA